ncbi:hypothetical protein MK280_14630 [Myxococcota bacterium]|nr:hypothetical protein [Myxococcota bacterium]
MIRNRKESEHRLAGTDSDLLGLIKRYSDEPPALSLPFQRSLREIPSRNNLGKERRSFLSGQSLAACAIAAALSVILFSLPKKTPDPLSNESLFGDRATNWNYQLFAPPEFDEFNTVYQSELTLPSEYHALEYWVY